MFQLQNRYGRLNEYFLALYILGLKVSECVVPRAAASTLTEHRIANPGKIKLWYVPGSLKDKREDPKKNTGNYRIIEKKTSWFPTLKI